MRILLFLMWTLIVYGLGFATCYFKKWIVERIKLIKIGKR